MIENKDSWFPEDEFTPLGMKSIDTWYPEDEYEDEFYKLTKKTFKHTFRTQMDSEFRGQFDGDIVLVLFDKVKKEIVMSNSVMEIRTNQEMVNQAKGRVLVAGMGISMITKALIEKDEVTEVVIVERDENLMKFMYTILSERLSHKKTIIHHCDIFDFKTDEKFDTIYFDIWNFIDEDNYPEMMTLHRTFRKNLVKGGYMKSWRFDTCRKLRAESEEW